MAGRVVLIQRGTCDFAVKVPNAADAGALAAIIFNEGQPGRQETLSGTLGAESEIPAIGINFALGVELYNQVNAGTMQVRIDIDSEITPIQTVNVLAERLGRCAPRMSSSARISTPSMRAPASTTTAAARRPSSPSPSRWRG